MQIKDINKYIRKKDINRPENIIKGVDPVAVSLLKQMYSALKDRGDNVVLYEKAWLMQIEKIYKDQDTYDSFFLNGLETLLKDAYRILIDKSKSWDVNEEEILAIAEKIIFLKAREDIYKEFFNDVESTLFSALQLDFSKRVKRIKIGKTQENIFTYKAVMINTLLETMESSVVSMASINEAFNNVPGVITIITNIQGSIRYINSLGKELLEGDTFIKKPISEIIIGIDKIEKEFKEKGVVKNLPFNLIVGNNRTNISVRINVSTCYTSPILEEIVYFIVLHQPKETSPDLHLKQKLHDKITPVNTLLAGLNLISYKLIDKDSKFLIESLKKTANRLKDNTNEELKLILSGSEMPLDEIMEIDLEEMINEIIEDVSLNSQHKIYFIKEIQRKPFYSKQRFIHSILLNLLSNAVKYSKQTKPNTIKITFMEQNGEFLLQISDTGVGMKKSKLKAIFDGKQKEIQNIEGNGIGLNIVKEYVEALNGKIEVESAFSVGTKFSLLLPSLNKNKKNVSGKN